MPGADAEVFVERGTFPVGIATAKEMMADKRMDSMATVINNQERETNSKNGFLE